MARHSEQEFLVKGFGRGQTNITAYTLNTFVNLCLEINILIVNDAEVRVTDPCIDKFLI